MHICINALLCISFLLSNLTPVFADEETGDALTAEDTITSQQSLPVETNEIPGWPQGPPIAAEAACLMDADTGVILYDKNMDKVEFPASTTKVLTCLVALENSSLDEMVTFSKEAVFGIDRGSSNVGMDVGQSITMEEAIYCIMLASANEVASAVAEHVGGSIEGFCEMMNERAKELGCTNTHFANANGLPNDEHYTTPHDLALIARAFNNNDTLVRIAGTAKYSVKATATQPDTFDMVNHHKMYPGQQYAYEFISWGKTGYTNAARQTLVTSAEKNGFKLVCVVMRDEKPYQYTDTHDLLEYGFANFKKEYIADNETEYNIKSSDFFDTDSDIFGNSTPLLTLNTSGICVMPKNTTFEDLNSSITYDDLDPEKPNSIANIRYYFEDHYVGGTTVDIYSNVQTFEFGDPVSTNAIQMDAANTDNSSNTINENTEGVVFVSVRKIIIIILIFIGCVILFFALFALIRFIRNSRHRRRRIKKRVRRYFSEFDDFDF